MVNFRPLNLTTFSIVGPENYVLGPYGHETFQSDYENNPNLQLFKGKFSFILSSQQLIINISLFHARMPFISSVDGIIMSWTKTKIVMDDYRKH